MAAKNFRTFVFLSVVAVSGCATVSNDPISPPLIENYADHNIIVETSRRGKLSQRGVCLTFTTGNAVFASQFARGTRFDTDARAVVLPNGDALPLGRRLTLSFEAPPNIGSAVPDCANLAAVQVIGIKK